MLLWFFEFMFHLFKLVYQIFMIFDKILQQWIVPLPSFLFFVFLFRMLHASERSIFFKVLVMKLKSSSFRPFLPWVLDKCLVQYFYIFFFFLHMVILFSCFFILCLPWYDSFNRSINHWIDKESYVLREDVI